MIVLLLWSLAACQEEPECSETTPCAFGAVCELGFAPGMVLISAR